MFNSNNFYLCIYLYNSHISRYSMTAAFTGFLCGSVGKESAWNMGDLTSIPGLGRFPGEGKGYPVQHSGLENPLDCIVHGVTKCHTWRNDFHFASPALSFFLNSFHFYFLLLCKCYIRCKKSLKDYFKFGLPTKFSLKNIQSSINK